MLPYRSHPHRPHSRRRVVTVLLPVVALMLWAATAAPPVQAQPAPTAVTFAYTGAAQSWTVPAGVTQATIDLAGAGGGQVRDSAGTWDGGAGARATATLPVTPGQVVTIMVGGAGGNALCLRQEAGGAGGFNGGGAGGGGGCPGASGGGATDVRIGGNTLADRVLVAGGGGGAANGSLPCSQANATPYGGPSGGAGGGLSGGDALCGGRLTEQLAFTYPPATGGDQSGRSGSGRLGQGSDGIAGAPRAQFSAFGFSGDGGGGGGGGGYYGGAGGHRDAGGGGGSSFGPAGTVFEPGAHRGPGVASITFSPTPPAEQLDADDPSQPPALPARSPEAVIRAVVEADGQQYAGLCEQTRSPDDIGKVCSRLIDQRNGAQAHLTGRTFSEFTTWVFIAPRDSGWTVVTTTSLDFLDTTGAVPWPR